MVEMDMLQEKIEAFELSPQQKHVWLLQSTDGIFPYRAQCSVLFEGHVNPDILKSAIEYAINRHEILRTNFKSVSGITFPLQVIGNHTIASSGYENLSGLSPGEQAIAIDAIWNKISQLPFDIANGAILHRYWIKLSTNKHLLMLNLPVLCADKIGLKNLVNEIIRCYDACLNSEELVDTPIQYVDISSWENELLQAERETGTYWQNHNLTDYVTLKLPFENKSAPEAKFAPRSFSATINAETFAILVALSKEHNISVDVLLLTCWQILLWRLTEQQDIVVSTAFDGRKYEELKEAIGLLVKYLPISCHLEESFKFSEILKQVDQSISDAYTLQEYFTWSHKPSHNKLEPNFLPFSFDFENFSYQNSLAGISVSINKEYVCCERYKIKLSCLQQHKALITEFNYDENFFSLDEIKCLAVQFQTLLTSVINNPHTIGDLEIINDAERQKLLVEFNDTKSDYPLNKCIHHLFESQVALTPNNIAVVFQDQQLTYSQLNQRANQLAYQLQKLGVKPEVLVAICMERSLEMIVAILGVLKSGSAYVPLDPKYPEQRLAFMLEDTQAPVIITQEYLFSIIPKHQAKVICLDTNCANFLDVSSTVLLECDVRPSNLAYLIYTSGSTGKPKGVMVTHQNLVHSTSSRFTYYSEKPLTSYLLLSSFAFDSSVAGIFWTLCQGGTLVLPQHHEQQDPAHLTQLIAKNQVSHLLCLPSLYALILEQAQPRQLQSLSTVIVAGEACPSRLIELHSQRLPLASLFNEYGPTEATVWSSVYKFECGNNKKQVLIGRPIANTQIYILNRNLKPVPIGVSGELYISGEGLTRGYLNRKELTAEKFIPNPFSDLPQARLYKTGDLARYLPDGNIEFLGRSDEQVKIRGFRIEIGEIEEVLAQHPKVKESAVTVQGDESDKRLVGYIVSNYESLTTQELQLYLKDKLPEYMIPRAFVILEALPLTPNGKVDRRLLPAPDKCSYSKFENFIPPRDTLELEIAQIWSNILNIHPIGVQDNFFQLGGHSLLAISMMNKIQQHFGKNLPLATLFQGLTIEQLACILRQESNTNVWSPLVAIKPQGSKTPLFFIHSAGGTVFGYFDLAYLLNQEQPFYALQARGIDLEQEPHTQVKEIAAYYIQALQSIQPQGPYFLGGWSFGGLVAFEMAQQLLAQNQQISFLGMLDTYAPNQAPIAPADNAALLVDRFGGDFSLSLQQMQQMEADEQLIYVLEKAKQANQLPPDFQLPQAKRLLQIYRLNSQAIQSYIPQHYPGQITLFRASEEIQTTSQDLSLGWREFAGNGVEIHLCCGNHRTMIDKPHVQVLAQKLQACLDK